MTDNSADSGLDLDGVPPNLLGAELARWMRGIDAAFLDAEAGEKVWGYVAALTSTMKVLKRLHGFDCEMLTLKDLQARLEKLTVGQKQPILTLIDAVKTPGRAPASFFDHVGEVRAVALVQALVNRGWSEAEACKLVADELARTGVKGRRGEPITARAVGTWRSDKIKANDPVYKSASKDFDELLPTNLSAGDMKKFVRAFVEAGRSMRD